MKLYGSVNSPFVRMVRILAGELGISDRVAFTLAEGTPFEAKTLRDKNPLKKIPFLETADGAILYDSRTVAEAMLMAAEPTTAARLLPAAGSERLATLTRASLGIGLCDVAVQLGYERRLRPAELHWPEWIELQLGKLDSALDSMEADIPPAGRFDFGDCAWAASLVYLDYRYPERPWRDGRPRLTAWGEQATARPAVKASL